MPWKLYVDSRRRVKGARGSSDADFAIALPRPIAVQGKAYIDVVLLSNNFYTIRAGECDRIYLDENDAATKRVAIIAPGQYTVMQANQLWRPKAILRFDVFHIFVCLRIAYWIPSSTVQQGTVLCYIAREIMHR